MTARRKTFTIEKQLTAGDGEHPSLAFEPIGDGISVRAVLGKLDKLGEMIQPTQEIAANIAEAYRREILEVMKLRSEMDAIQSAILETKRQVVSFHAAAPRAVNVNHAAGELGAVVSDTEDATNAVLTAAEKIEMLAGVIQSETTPEAMKARAGELALCVQSIYEACNFQDLTGQRITRVCETLTFVEERIFRMADVWGGLDSLSTSMAADIGALRDKQSALGTHALATGPALVGAEGHVSQDDIDALFN
jgi:chemotaxis protein CheZ